MHRPPAWRVTADAWFKLCGAVVLGYLILGGVVSGFRHFAYLAIILVGAIMLAYLVLPAVRWLQNRMPLWAALAVVYAGGVLGLAAILYVLVPIASAQFASLAKHAPAYERAVESFFTNPHNALVRHLPTSVQSWIRKLPAQIAMQFQRNAASFTSSLFNALSTLTVIGALVIAIPVVSIYIIAEAPMMYDFVLSRVAVPNRHKVAGLVSDIDTVLGGFVRGQLIVAAVVGVLATIALLVLGIPYALLIGAWAGIADIIPYVGPFAGALPAGIVAIVDKGWGSVLGLVIAFVAINQIEGHLLGPRIVSRTVRISPLGVIVALLIGAQLFGFVGLIVAVPLAGLVRVALIRIFPQRKPATNPNP